MFYGKLKQQIVQLINQKKQQKKKQKQAQFNPFIPLYSDPHNLCQEITKKQSDTSFTRQPSAGHKVAGASAEAASQTD